ncbi:MAG TPA: Gfo/Idh/MocA family oxidoreductase [Magnetospirillaceae bacterium]|jgi:predicted dehydrogenase
MKRLGYGLIGSGFMGKCHAHAMYDVARTFALSAEPVLEMLADVNADVAGKAAAALGFARSTGDWQALVNDPKIDIVSITTPNTLHKPMALAAIAAGKTVWCEKPLAATPADAKEMAEAAKKAGAKTIVGFNYLRHPLMTLAKDLITSGEIGEVISFRGVHLEDYMADPTAPWSFRTDPVGGHGAIADIGSHILSLARYLMGEIDELSGQTVTVIKHRPIAPGAKETRPIEVDDQARALIKFTSGATGNIEASWIAQGRKLTLAFELTGSKGTILLDFERMNELQLYIAGQPKGRTGFTTILAGADHPHYGAFTPAAGHHIGFNDLKTIEAKILIDAMTGTGNAAAWPDFTDAWRIQQAVEAIVRSSREKRWIKPSEM